ncbi:hypothetical protein Bbelb_186600 [Branchiostoma belcheri]|nr:hypothetical protein Bbelb_186600 [Branchiostoma belcheri]
MKTSAKFEEGSIQAGFRKRADPHYTVSLTDRPKSYEREVKKQGTNNITSFPRKNVGKPLKLGDLDAELQTFMRNNGGVVNRTLMSVARGIVLQMDYSLLAGYVPWANSFLKVRTNNDTEGWHLRLKQKANRLHLPLYLLVQLLKREADFVTLQVQQLSFKKLKRYQRARCASVQGKLFKY